MTETKYYHIYLKDRCVLPNLEEEKFEESWEILNTLVGFMQTDYDANDLSYELVTRQYSTEENSY
jgi:hypothetical protein